MSAHTPARLFIALAAIAAIAAAAGAARAEIYTSGPAAATPASSATPAQVQLINYAFRPSVVTIDPGTTVNWLNSDTGVFHNVTAAKGAFNSQNLGFGMVFSFTFTKPGTYDYYCGVHPYMKGTVVVRGKVAAESPSPAQQSLTPPPPSPQSGY